MPDPYVAAGIFGLLTGLVMLVRWWRQRPDPHDDGGLLRSLRRLGSARPPWWRRLLWRLGL